VMWLPGEVWWRPLLPIARTSNVSPESKAPASSADHYRAGAVYLRPTRGIRSESSCDRGRLWSQGLVPTAHSVGES